MAGKQACGRAALVLLLGLLAPATVLAGPYLGDWGWCWHPAPDCPHGSYSPAHYWTPTYYRFRAWVHPSNLDQYPPGPCPTVPPTYDIYKSKCRTEPPFPSTPYANPAAYYGREP